MLEFNEKNIDELKDLQDGDFIQFTYDDGRKIFINVEYKNNPYKRGEHYCAKGTGNIVYNHISYENSVRTIIARNRYVLSVND